MPHSKDLKEHLEWELEMGTFVGPSYNNRTPSADYLAHMLQHLLVNQSYSILEKYTEAISKGEKECPEFFRRNLKPIPILIWSINNPSNLVICTYPPTELEYVKIGDPPKKSVVDNYGLIHKLDSYFTLCVTFKNPDESLYLLDKILEHTVHLANFLVDEALSAYSTNVGIRDPWYYGLIKDLKLSIENKQIITNKNFDIINGLPGANKEFIESVNILIFRFRQALENSKHNSSAS